MSVAGQAVPVVASEFTQNLRRAVEKKGGQVAFAALCGLKQQDISSYLNGTMPSAERVVRIARAAGVSVERLFGVADSPSQSVDRLTQAVSDAGFDPLLFARILIAAKEDSRWTALSARERLRRVGRFYELIESANLAAIRATGKPLNLARVKDLISRRAV